MFNYSIKKDIGCYSILIAILYLLSINNVFRSFANVMLLLLCSLVIKNIDCISSFVVGNINWIAIISLFILFLFSVRKQTKFVRDRVEANKEDVK